MPTTTGLSELDLDLDFFQGPFDLLLSLILNEEIDLLEVDLAEIVLTYLTYLEEKGELDLEVATEFLVLIAALLELKSRLMLPSEDGGEAELAPDEAAEELVARMLEYQRHRGAADWLVEQYGAQAGYNYRSVKLPADLRKVSVDAARKVYEPNQLPSAVGVLLTPPLQLKTEHMKRVAVSLERCIDDLRTFVAKGRSFTFDEVVDGEDRMTEAVTLIALLELYRKGEVNWRQQESFGPITIRPSIRESMQ